MAKPEPKKRKLKFVSFDQMFEEIEQLIERGYSANGSWKLSQTLGHISDWMRFPIDGFPTPPIYLRPIFWIMKVTVGQRMKRNIMANGFSGGMPTAPETVPAADAQSDREALESLRRTVERVTSHRGELLPSPLFGPMDLETLKQVTLLHAEHHLGYLEPK